MIVRLNNICCYIDIGSFKLEVDFKNIETIIAQLKIHLCSIHTFSFFPARFIIFFVFLVSILFPKIINY